MDPWYVYIIECADHTLYTGITSNLDRRITAHNAGTSGAKYVRHRRPVTLVYSQGFTTRGIALKEEFRIKQLSKLDKIALIQSGPPPMESPPQTDLSTDSNHPTPNTGPRSTTRLSS